MALHPNLSDGTMSNIMIEKKLKARPLTQTLAGNLTLTVDHPPILFLDPGGAGRTITLPAEADSEGLMFIISNEADAAEILTVENDAAGAIVTPTQNEAAIVFCDGVTWSGLVGATA